MFGRLLPREGRFYDLFAAHADLILRAGHELVLLLKDFDNREAHTRVIIEAEHSADRVTADAMRLLHKTFITPIDREQIHQLVTAMDDICDLIQDVTESVSLYDIRTVTPEMLRLADIACECCERVREVVALLEKDKHTEAVVRTCAEIDRLEGIADHEMRAAISRLFREEQDVREVIKMKVIYEQLESITDRCEDVANLAEGIVLSNA